MPINVSELTKTGIYQTKATIEIIARDMDEIDALRVSRRKQKNQFFTLAAIAFVAGAVLTAVTPWIGVPILIIFGGLVYAGTMAHRSTPEGPDRTNLVKGLVTKLANDAHPRAPVSVWISLDQKGNTISEKPWPVKKKGKERRATCDWLRMETTLLDGTELSQTITDFFRDRTYTNPRGKFKKKRRITAVVVQKYGFPPEIYGDPARFPDEEIGKLIHLPPSATLRGLRLTDKTLTAKVQVKSGSDLLQSCTMLSLGVYRIFNLARLVAQR